jgi:hypothetical protein
MEGPPFLFVSPFYLPTYLQSYVGCTYVPNSDEGPTERALDSVTIDSMDSKQKLKDLYQRIAINCLNFATKIEDNTHVWRYLAM